MFAIIESDAHDTGFDRLLRFARRRFLTFYKSHVRVILDIDICCFGDHRERIGRPDLGGCKIGNVYIATTLLPSKSYQIFRVPATPMASPFSLP